MREFEIWTDGGCHGNPGPGGWGFLIAGVDTEKKTRKIFVEDCGAEKATTNNRMELCAVISALETFAAGKPGSFPALKPGRAAARMTPVTIFTDSQYVKNGITDWIENWKERNWRTSDGDPVKNQDLWRRLDELAACFAIRWKWVKGHSGNPMNERCDELTQIAIGRLPKPRRTAARRAK
jgi:ribonuclease HI